LNINLRSATWRKVLKQADDARDAQRYREAAGLYRRVLQINPKAVGIHLQAGNMFKEIGEYGEAEPHYIEASNLMPDSAEAALQVGHFYKTFGQLDQAFRSYRRALELEPRWPIAQEELASMRRSGWVDQPETEGLRNQPVVVLEELGPEARPDDLTLSGLYGKLAPELLPKPLHELLHYSHDSISLRQFGVEQNTFWGRRKVARGVEAIRGVCISKIALHKVHASVNGLPIYNGVLKGPFELEFEPDKTRIHKYTFNIWTDFSNFAPGLYGLELRFPTPGEADRLFTEEFVVEAPLEEVEHPDSDGIINLTSGASGTIYDQVMARPPVVHDAERSNQIGPIHSILLTRSDQLGDFVASIPGVLRVRELFPDAKLVGLCSPSNADLARSLEVFDDIVVIDHAESWHQRLRTLSLAHQEEIRETLAPYKFDVAIDLAVSRMGRPLLALSGARFTHGFRDPDWPRLSSYCDDAVADPKNHREVASHSKRVVSMVERLGALTRPTAKVIRRNDLSTERLRTFGLEPGDRFAVLHAGARIVWSRWAHYPELARRLLEDTDLKVVLFTADRAMRDSLPPELVGSSRLVLVESLVPFDDFDALMHFCALYVGNDSGPKHLASLRGANVVSVHSARINWSEWGQEHGGAVVSRKVPCAGCHIYHDPDECGKDFACMKIGFDDVYKVVRRYV
jgi:ADP-heptose:LPS heptosyltransferase